LEDCCIGYAPAFIEDRPADPVDHTVNVETTNQAAEAPVVGFESEISFGSRTSSMIDVRKEPEHSVLGESTDALVTSRNSQSAHHLRARMMAGWIAVITVAFVQPLIRLALYAAQSDLFSYILLVPFAAGYLLFIKQRPFVAAFHRSIRG